VTASRRASRKSGVPLAPSTTRGALARWLAALPRPPEGALPADRRTSAVLVVATLLLIVFQYFGKPEALRGSALGAALQPVADAWLGNAAGIAPFAWWALMSLVLRIAIPLGIVLLLFREPPAAYGWKWRGTLVHAPTYVALYLLVLPFILWAASLESFQLKYPFYKAAAAGGATFWTYELLYGIQFAGVENFFRGFLLFALFRRFGYNALLVVAVPYVMVHFNKPLPEVFGALGAAVLLGTLALRYGSCVPGIFLHWAVGITMDVLAIARSLGGMGAALRALFS
jgi:hypothetical protein